MDYMKFFSKKGDVRIHFNIYDIILNFLILSIATFSSVKIIVWSFFEANWSVVSKNLALFTFGSYPYHDRWRPSIWIIYLLILCFFTIFNKETKKKRRPLVFAWGLFVPTGLFLVCGGLGKYPIPISYLGGLSLTIMLTSCSLLFSFPFGIFLALCRQSELFLVRNISKLYIDFMRSFPLITVLFFGQLLIPLFLPNGVEVNRVARAVFAFTIFLSAYIAEDFRCGLQSIPVSQIEAGKVLGFNDFQITSLIVLPQAFTIALPALTNQVIGLFQNTSLMSILGLAELLGISRSLLANPEFIGSYLEVYIWLGLIYWLFCTIIAMLGRYFEYQLDYDGNNR